MSVPIEEIERERVLEGFLFLFSLVLLEIYNLYIFVSLPYLEWCCLGIGKGSICIFEFVTKTSIFSLENYSLMDLMIKILWENSYSLFVDLEDNK